MKIFYLLTCLTIFGCSSSRPSSSSSSKKSSAFPESKGLKDPGALLTKRAFKPQKYIEIILDASGSMGEVVEGETKIKTAKEMLNIVAQSLQEEQIAISLTAFGHRKSWSCKDIELIFDTQFKTREEILERIKPINPSQRGKTPIAATLLRSYERLKKIRGPKGIFVITDGAETCGGDPCTVAKIMKKELDVQIYTLSYKTSSVEDFKKLSCMGQVEEANSRGEVLSKLTTLKQAFDQNIATKDYAKNMEGLVNTQTLRVLGPDPEAWATAKNISTGLEQRFLSSLGTSLAVGSYEVTVHYNPPYIFDNVSLKEKENKTITVSGAGSLALELDFPGITLKAVNILDSKNYEVVAGKASRVPIGRYNVFGLSASGFAFQWLNENVTPGGTTTLSLPNWGLIDVKTDKATNYDVFLQGDYVASKDDNTAGAKKVSQYKNSIGFFATNSPQVLEPGNYMIIMADGSKFENIVVKKGDKIVLEK